jgi:hypothetical protein
MIDRAIPGGISGKLRRAARLCRSALAGRDGARFRRLVFEEMEDRILLAGGLDRLGSARAHRLDAVRRPPALTARLAGPPDGNGEVVVIGRAVPETTVRLELGADRALSGHTRTNARGQFRFHFYVRYGTTPIALIDGRPGQKLRVAELSVNRPDTSPPTLEILSPSPSSSSSTDVTVTGVVSDDQSGIGTLTARLDGGPPVAVAVAQDGSFSYTPQLLLDATANGPHVVQFVVTNASGNLSTSASRTFNLEARPPGDAVVLSILDQPNQPVLTVGDPGTEGNEYGFEGGSVVALNGLYYLFTSEMVGDPFGVMMRLAIWTSPDGTSWTRVSTLYQSSGTSDGTDPRAALWSPMPIFDQSANRWDLFYVAYHSLPSTSQEYLANNDGEIVRAVSTRPGLNGIEGPYQDVGVVLQPGPDSQPWEGIQGVDSFYPYQVGDQWYAFYGTASAVQTNPFWDVGLAEAPDLSGPWTRLPRGNPVPLDPVNGVENPIVTRLASGQYIAVFDALGYTDRIGYTVSVDGIHWSPAQYLQLESSNLWTQVVRTPLGLIPNADGTATLFYTGYYDDPGVGNYSALGMLKLRIALPA